MKLNSLKNKILIAVIGIILFFGSFATLVIFINTKNVLLEMQKNALTIATLQETHTLFQVFERSSDLVKAGSEDSELKSYLKGDKDTQNGTILKYLEKYNIDSKYLAIYMMNTDGTVIISTDESFVGHNVAYREYFKTAMEGNPGVDVAIGTTSKQLGYYFSHPIKENNEILGVLVAKLNPEEIYSILNSKNNFGELFNSSRFILIDDSGIVLYSAKEDMIFKSLGVLSDAELESIKNRKRFGDIEISPLAYDVVLNNLPKARDFEFFSIYDEYDEKHENLLIAKVPQYPFYLMLEIELKNVSKSAMFSSLMIGLFVLLAALSAMLLILLVASKFLKPLNKLTEMAKEISKGNYKERIEIQTKDEFENLGKTFNKMAKKLDESRIKTEEKIKKRTKELMKHKNDLENQQKAVLNVLEDVAEEKEKNAKERDKMNTILYSIGDGVFVVDNNLKIQVFNKMASEISGLREDEVLGKKYTEVLKFVSESNRELTDQFIFKALDTGKPQFMEVDSVLIRKDGTEVPVADSAAPLKDEHGKVVGCIVVFRDVRKDREIEKMKTEFVSIASHQLRTPLTALRWNLEMFEKGLLGRMNEKQTQAMKQIVKTHRYMLFLVNDILDVARIDSGRFGLTPHKIQLEESILKASDNVKLRAHKKNIQISLPKFKKKLPHVYVDPTKIFEVIQNLIENAVKYTGQGKKIEVKYELSKDKKSVVLQVKDQGIGIPKDEQKKMFSKFFRAKNAIATKKTGTGLGLYIAKNIVEMSNGRIWFDSKENKGTTFYIKLPIINHKKNG